ncbi:outer membrane protein assembly factor BamB family protein [Haloferax larsenii]|uniref:Outer membrane protein assembly factor BamB, contains PQQ-like beta-propeller repeat n=1 Tax=Haloferax larsenii TaxID=302484 RepID=A0A1H7RQX0_HALLR|nr:PQQ-binding-like beta-propeller repeat protein [Haloferax larsenii]SEL62234.1 Outer membrane protein assembly factor BamB, contains PQQ-like beta-propeller repeat [Haloferax larsenii]
MPSSNADGSGPDSSRRKFLTTVGAVSLAGIAGCSETNRFTTITGSWPTRGYDAARTGAPEDVSGPKPPLDRRWKAAFPGDWNKTSPVVVGDTVYLGTMVGGLSGEVAETFLSAYDASTGEKHWSRSIERYTPEQNRRYGDSLTATEDALYLQTFRGLRALDFDGREQWVFENTGPDFGGTCHPAVVDGVAYTGAYGSTTGDDEGESAGSAGVFAVDTEDGSSVWRFTPEKYVSDRTFSPTAADGMVFVSFWQSAVVALDATDGSVLWKREIPADTPVTVRNGVAFVATDAESDDYRLYALDATTGETVWNRAIGGAWPSRGISHDGDALYLSSDRYLLSIDAETGDERWRAFREASDSASKIDWIDDEHGLIAGLGIPVVVGDIVYTGDGEYGTLVALDRETGTLLDAAPERRSGASGSECSPAVADGVVYYTTPHWLHAVDANTVEFWRR